MMGACRRDKVKKIKLHVDMIQLEMRCQRC
jgi:hypothetical protein